MKAFITGIGGHLEHYVMDELAKCGYKSLVQMICCSENNLLSV